MINDYTFRGCASLYSLKIPVGVTSIGVDVLRGCSMLHTLKIAFVGMNANPGVSGITNEGVLGYFFGRSDVFTYNTDVEQVYNSNGNSHFYHASGTLKNVSVLMTAEIYPRYPKATLL